MSASDYPTMRRLAITALTLLTLASAGVAARHFSLVRSLPAADTTIQTSPEKLQLWFSQVPAMGVSQLKLGVPHDPRLELEIGKTVIEAQDKSLTAPVTKPLAPGAYVIRWRGAGDDGHVMSGEIKFSVAPPSAAR